MHLSFSAKLNKFIKKLKAFSLNSISLCYIHYFVQRTKQLPVSLSIVLINDLWLHNLIHSNLTITVFSSKENFEIFKILTVPNF